MPPATAPARVFIATACVNGRNGRYKRKAGRALGAARRFFPAAYSRQSSCSHSLARSTALLHPVSRLLRRWRSEEHTSELQSRENLVCRLLLEKKKRHNPHQVA